MIDAHCGIPSNLFSPIWHGKWWKIKACSDKTNFIQNCIKKCCKRDHSKARGAFALEYQQRIYETLIRNIEELILNHVRTRKGKAVNV